MPKLNGIEVLDFIKKDEKLKRIPVVMLTTSSAESDITECYSKSANCYITKPLDFGKFQDVVEAIESFWFSIAQLPKTA
jgi:two-component system response regulator